MFLTNPMYTDYLLGSNYSYPWATFRSTGFLSIGSVIYLSAVFDK
jgi:hypothetical protein